MSAARGIPPMLAWLFEPRGDRRIRFRSLEQWDVWDSRSYAELAELSWTVKGALDGARSPGSALVVVPGGAAFVASYFGCQLAGLTPTVIPSPLPLQDPAEYVAGAARICRLLQPQVVFAEGQVQDLLRKALAEAGVDATVIDPREAMAGSAEGVPLERIWPEVPILQFTSGSTGVPRGVRVSWDNIAHSSAVNAMLADLDPAGESASWLPFNHDFGLVGTLITCVSVQANLSVMSPEHFILDPASWLACFGREGASFTCAPPFAFAYSARKVKPEQLEGMDFSGWRVAILGAERMDSAALWPFVELCRPFGFSARTLRPNYGMAEATLPIAGVGSSLPVRAVRLDWDALAFGGRAPVLETGSFEAAGTAGNSAEWLVGSGTPVGGTTARIVGDSGEDVAEGVVGEILLRGAGITDGYVHMESGGPESATRFLPDGELATGDAGFWHENQIYVVGRMGDSIKLRGRSVFMEDLDARLCQTAGIPRGRLCTFSDGRALVVLVEQEEGPWCEAVRRAAAAATGRSVPVVVAAAARGTVLRTSSGKPRRRHMAQMFSRGELAGRVVAPVPAQSAQTTTPPAGGNERGQS